MKSLLSKQSLKNIGIRTAGTLAIPVIFVIVTVIVCAAGGTMYLSTPMSFTNFVSYAAVVMITTIALSINLGSGRFDFSLGSIATLSSIIGAKITYSMVSGGSGSVILMLLFGVIFGAILGAVSGGLYVLLKIPPIITSLGVTLIYEGISFALMEGRYVMTEVQSSGIMTFRTQWYWFFLIILAVLAISILVFDHTKFGREYRSLKEGQNVSVNTGIKEIPNAIICYAICGAFMGIVGFIQATRNTTISSSVLNFGSISIMFTAFLPMFIGGFIGRFSNDKLGYLLAAVSMSLLNSMFEVLGTSINASTQSIINALLLVVFLIFLNNEQTCRDLITGRLFKKWAEQFREWKAKRVAKKQNGGA